MEFEGIKPQQNEQVDYTFKILLIGESGVGKTAILERYCDNVFNDTLLSTVGVDFKSKTLQIENKQVKIQLWDTAGQEKFRNITSSYYRGTHGCLIIYDVMEPMTFDKINYWLNELSSEKQIPEIIIVGNKIDMGEKRVTDEMVTNYLNENKQYIHCYCSAKTGENIEAIFATLIHNIYNNKDIMSKMKTPTSSFQMQDVSLQQQQSNGSCC